MTSSCGKTGDNLEPTNKLSGKTTKAKLKHDVREPAKTVDMVPGLKNNSLISGPKFADAGYITVLTPTELLIYDGVDLQMAVNKDAFIKGWRDANGLWRMPLGTSNSKHIANQRTTCTSYHPPRR